MKINSILQWLFSIMMVILPLILCFETAMVIYASGGIVMGVVVVKSLLKAIEEYNNKDK